MRQKNTHHFFARRHFAQNSFYTAETLPHRSLYGQIFLMHSNFSRQMVLTESSTHRRFYAQHFLHTDALYTDAFTRKTNCTQKLVHTAHFYTQPVFTQRGPASPSSSPTFRVPPFQVAFTYQLAETHIQPYGHSAHVVCAGVGARFTWSPAEIMELPMVTPSGHSYDFTSIVPHPGTELKLHDQPRQNNENMTRYCI